MNLIKEYDRQYRWRSWETVYDRLPDPAGQRILDLGCAVGNQAADFIARGAEVTGVDLNETLLNEARSRCPRNARFIHSDFRTLPDLGRPFDGLWCSFGAAYLTDFAPVLNAWLERLRQGGWIALTEVDRFFGHEPLSKYSRDLLEGYVRDSYQKGRYDFNMGGKLEVYLRESGVRGIDTLTLPDRELSFSGPATPDVVTAWRNRFERMGLLRDFCGSRFPKLKEEFLSCLAREDHQSTCRVICCVGRR